MENNLGELIRKHLKTSKITQLQLAGEIGLSKNAVSDIILNKSQPSKVTIDKIKNILNIEIIYSIKSKQKMDIREAVLILEQHNKWRKGDEDVVMVNPRTLSSAIDIAIKKLKTIK